MKISVYRKMRATPVHLEYVKGFLFKFGIASSVSHKWWAFTVYVYF